MDTARITTPCRVYMHPACTDPYRPFEVRRLARDVGAAFISISRRRLHSASQPSQGPFGGEGA